MAVFSYQVQSIDGERHSGELIADNENSALQKLTRNGTVVLRLRCIDGKSSISSFKSFKRISLESIIAFFSQFSFLVRSGMPLFQSLEMVIGQTRDDRMKIVLQQMRQDLSNGYSLSQAMKRHTSVFNDLHVSMVIVGEGAGKLDQAFERIVEVIENERALKKKIQKITNYVVLMLSIAAVVMSGVLIFVFPKFAAIFNKVGMDLPLSTEIMMALSEFFLANMVAIPLVVLMVGMGLFLLFRSQNGKQILDHIKLHLPVIRDININAALADFSNTFGSLLNTGVPVLQALEICRDSTSNQVIKPVLSLTIKEVREGATIADCLNRNDLFPTVMVQLTAAGENSGELDVMMDKIHLYFKERVDDSVDRFTAVMEPAMLVILGGLVLVMAMSIFLPMFNLAGAVRQ